MVREFKKTGVAVALTGALLATASMTSQATVQLTNPGDVLLVPYVLCDPTANNTNTLVGLITFYKERLGLGNGYAAPATQPYLPAPTGVAGVTPYQAAVLPARVTSRPTTTRTLHWYFYDSRSVHKLDGVIPVTDNDFVRFDWCTTIKTLGFSTLYGTKGYLIFTDDFVDTKLLNEATPSYSTSFALYGHSYQITGNWASMAFIPVLANPLYAPANPLADYDAATNPYTWNVWKSAGYPAFRRLVVGTDFTDYVRDGVTVTRDIYTRYFLDPALATRNDLVFWFNNNQDVVRAGVPGENYDSEQVYRASYTVPMPNEVNVITLKPNDPTNIIPATSHSETESYDTASKFTVVNTGILRFGVPQVESTVSWASSGVSFNLISLGSGGNASQVQTELTTEGSSY